MPKYKLIIKRTILITTTLLISAVFFSLLSGMWRKINISDNTWQDTEIKNIDNTAQTSQLYGTNKYSIISMDKPAGVYKNTNPDTYSFLWQEDFNGEELNNDKFSCVERINNDNNELQAYLSDNVTVSNGVLSITAKKEKTYGKKYSSGMIETLNKEGFLYGKIEIRASIPKGQGFFPAIWMLCESGNKFEIDILEALGQDPSLIYGVNHFYSGREKLRTYDTVRIDNPQDFHIYSIEWKPDELIWSVDNVVFHKTSQGIPKEKMYLILNLAVGGVWPGDPDSDTVFPNSFIIDYIRVYEYTGKK